MPVTARLSKKFYDALGEDVANELVDWFNQVDATYRADLRELNDLNFQRFDAKMGERMAQSEAKMEKRIGELEAKFERRITEAEAKLEAILERRLSELGDTLRGEMSEMKATLVSQEQFAGFRAEMSDKLNDLLKWMIVLWIGTVLAVITTGILG